MKKTIHIEGEADKLNLSSELSDNYDLSWSFDFDEESNDVIENVFLCSCVSTNLKPSAL